MNRVRVHLHGRLRERFGEHMDVGVSTPAAAFRALMVMKPGFRQEIAGGSYRIMRGDIEGGLALDQTMLHMNVGDLSHLHVIPIAVGGSKGILKSIVGALIIVAAVATAAWTGGFTLAGTWAALTASGGFLGFASLGGVALFGAALLLGGISKLISPHPGLGASYLLSGQQNTTMQGTCVPLVYGLTRVGSVIIASSYSAEDYNTYTSDYKGYAAYYDSNSGNSGALKSFDTGNPLPTGAQGFGGGKGGGGSGGIEAPNTLESKAIVRMIDLISEGPCGGLLNGPKDIYFNGTPLMDGSGNWNFRGVSYIYTLGNPSQTPVAGFSDVEETTSVGPTQVFASTPVIQTVNSTTADRCRVTISLPALYATNTQDGDVNPSSISLRIDIAVYGGAYSNVVDETISGKCDSTYQRSYVFPLPQPGGVTSWNVRVTKTSPDSDIATTINQLFWSTYDTITDYKMIYPDSAYLCLVLDAEAFGSNLPARTYNWQGIECSVPANYNAATRTYATSGPGTSSGTWDGVSFSLQNTSNPCWATYDFLRNTRYGLGLNDQQVEIVKYQLYTAGQYADVSIPDGFGGMEPRYTLNGVFAQQTDAFKMLQAFAATFRAMIYWAGGQVCVTADMPKAPVKLYNSANVIDGLFTYEGTSLKARHTMVNVHWTDPSQLYREAIETVEYTPSLIARGIFSEDMIGFGVTSRGLARRTGNWLLYTDNEQTETATWSVGLDSIDVTIGDIVEVSDPAQIGTQGGGRLAAGSTEVTAILDRIFSPQGGTTYTLTAVMPDNTISAAIIEGFQTVQPVAAPFLIGEDFTAEASASSIVNISRASIGTYFDQNGVMQVAPINNARIDHLVQRLSDALPFAADEYQSTASLPFGLQVLAGGGTFFDQNFNLNQAAPNSPRLTHMLVPPSAGLPAPFSSYFYASNFPTQVGWYRPSTATYIDTNGVMQVAGANAPRFGAGGLVAEGAAINLVPSGYPPSSSAGWSVAASAAAPPLLAGQAVYSHTRANTLGDIDAGFIFGAVPLGSAVSMSCYVWIPIGFLGAAIQFSSYELSPFASQSANMGKVGAWQRVTASGITTGSDGNFPAYLDCIGGLAGAVFYSTCWQIELGPSATSFIPNGGIRLADFAVVPAGIMSEQASTNFVTNSVLAGAAAGIVPSQSTSSLCSGMSMSVVGVGSANGIPYVDLRFQGTPGGNYNVFAFGATASVADGQTWTGSLYGAVIGGSMTNVSQISVDIRTESGIYSGAQGIVGSQFQRYSTTATFAGADEASAPHYASVAIDVRVLPGRPVDITIRLGAPQLEPLPYATSIIQTTTAGPVFRQPDLAVSPMGLLIEPASSNLISGGPGSGANWSVSPASGYPAALLAGETVYQHTCTGSGADTNAGFTSMSPTSQQVVYSCYIFMPVGFSASTFGLRGDGTTNQNNPAINQYLTGQWVRVVGYGTGSGVSVGPVLACVAAVGSVFYSTCWQAEVGPEATSYVTRQTTRQVETLTLGAGLMGTINAGTLVVEAQQATVGDFDMTAQFGSGNNFAAIAIGPSVTGTISASGVTTIFPSLLTIPGQPYREALSWGNGAYDQAIDGQIIDSIQGAADLGINGGGGLIVASPRPIWLRKAFVYPYKRSGNDLATLSSLGFSPTSEGAATGSGYTVCSLLSSLGQAPLANAIYIITSQGELSTLWQVLGISEPQRGQFKITAAFYNPNKFTYVEEGILFDIPQFSNIGAQLIAGLPAPTNVSLKAYVIGTGTTTTSRLTISWTPGVDARIDAYQIAIVNSAGNTVKVVNGQGASVDVDGLSPDTYGAGVRAISASGQSSAWAYSPNVALNFNSNTAPDAPTGLIGIGGVSSASVLFNDSTQRDVDHYELWRSSNSTTPGASGSTAIRVGTSGGSIITDHSTNLTPLSTWYYWVCAVTTTNVYSPFTGPVQISILQVTNGQMQLGSVGTTTIAESAVTQGSGLVLPQQNPVDDPYPSESSASGTLSIMVVSGAYVLLFIDIVASNFPGGTAVNETPGNKDGGTIAYIPPDSCYLTVTRGGTNVGGCVVNGPDSYASGCFVDYPGPGEVTYTLTQIYTESSSNSANNSNITWQGSMSAIQVAR